MAWLLIRLDPISRRLEYQDQFAKKGPLREYGRAIFANGKEYHTLVTLAAKTGYSKDYLRQLANAGHIDAIKMGSTRRGIWLASESSLHQYLEESKTNYQVKKTGRPRKPNGNRHAITK